MMLLLIVSGAVGVVSGVLLLVSLGLPRSVL
jgi:hypothetical protein